MNLFTISSGQIASSVWSSATRTLTNSPVASIAEEVFSPVSPQSVLNSTSFGAYVQIVASTAHTVRGIKVVLQAASTSAFQIAFASGGAGSEVNRCFVEFNPAAANQTFVYVFAVDSSLWPKASRVSVANACFANNVAATSISVGVVLMEATD